MDEIIVEVSEDDSGASAANGSIPAANASTGDSGTPAAVENEIAADVPAGDSGAPAVIDNESVADVPADDSAAAAANENDIFVNASGDTSAAPAATVEEFKVTASDDAGAIPVTYAKECTVSASSDEGAAANTMRTVDFMEADMSMESYAVLTEDADIAVEDIVVPDVTVSDGQSDSSDPNAELQQEVSILQEAYDQMKANRESAEAQIRVYIDSLGMTNMDEKSVLTALDEQISTMETSLSEVSSKLVALEEAQAQLDEGRKQLKAAKKQAQDGQSQVIDGQSKLTTQQILATIEMSVGEANLASAQAQAAEKEASLSAARDQLDAQKDQLDDALKSALDAGNLENIITRELIAGILASENFSMPAGYLTEGKDSWLVRVGDKVADSDQLEDLVILDLDLDGLDPIRLSDVADVTRTDNSGKVYSKLNGKPAVQITIQKQTGYSTGEVTDKLKKRLKEISAENHQIHFSIMRD